MSDREISMPRVFERVCALGMALGWENISLEPGCREHQIDSNWWFAINPHQETTPCSRGAKIPACQVYFEWKGWPAGMVSTGGGMMACGTAANEASLIEAIEEAIRRAGCHQ